MSSLDVYFTYSWFSCNCLVLSFSYWFIITISQLWIINIWQYQIIDVGKWLCMLSLVHTNTIVSSYVYIQLETISYFLILLYSFIYSWRKTWVDDFFWRIGLKTNDLPYISRFLCVKICEHHSLFHQCEIKTLQGFKHEVSIPSFPISEFLLQTVYGVWCM